MTAHLPASPTQPPSTVAAPRRRRLFAGAGLLLAVLAAAGAWWWFRRPAPAPPEPPMPADIQEAEVRQAIEKARRKVLAEPRSGHAWGLLGMTLIAHLFDREADRCFAEAAQLDPAEPRWPYGRALIALKRDPDAALPLLRQAVAADEAAGGRQSAYRLQLAETLLERRQLDEAETIFRDEHQRRPDDPRAALGLALIALERGDRQTARGLLLTAAKSPFARKKAMAQLAALVRAGGDRTAAEQYEKEAAELPDDPPWSDPMLDEVLRLQVGRRGRERAVDRLEQQHRFAEAAQVYLEQIEVQPTARACVGAGLNLARLGEYERALPLLREGVRLGPDSARAHYTLALAQFSRAEKAWQQTPGSPEAKEWFAEAIEHARRAAQLKPDHARAYLFWGLALKYLGDPAAALAPLRKGVACRPELFDLQLALGEALLEAGHKQEAATHLENARRLDPKDPRPGPALERARRTKD